MRKEKQKKWTVEEVRERTAGGMTTPQVRALAREIGRDHDLAEKLWATGVRDAMHVGVSVAEAGKVTPEMMERWSRGFVSWDLVDDPCCHLFSYSPHAWKKAVEWAKRKEEFVKRAGYALMAYLAVHDKEAADAKFEKLLPLIRRGATDERHFVKKAVNWALRQIGKRNLRLNRLAIAEGERIRKINSPAARWIAADALRELKSSAVVRRLKKART